MAHWILGILLAVMPIVLADADDESAVSEDTPVTHEEIAGDAGLTGARPWRHPDYSKQESAMGYSADLFKPPKELETNFKFWLDVYTKYTTDQGVLHDSEHIDLVYEAMDFTHISSRTDLDAYQKDRLRKKLVKDAKKRVAERLKNLDKIKDSNALTDEEKKIVEYFEKNGDKPKRYADLNHRNRLRFQLGQRDRIVQGIFFSGRYLEDFEKVFKEAGLPMELTRLVFVESSFNVLARSKVGASGLWQIMRYTARPYMMVNNTIDKRNHPTEATKLAAKLLRNNYELLQSWPLAITGYNHGPHGVLRLTKLEKTRELKDLVLNPTIRRRLGFASRNFYVSLLAIIEAEKNATFYFGPVSWSQPLGAADIKLKKVITYDQLLGWFDGNDKITQIFNPHITSQARKKGAQIPKGAVISVPMSKEQTVLAEIDPSAVKPVETTTVGAAKPADAVLNPVVEAPKSDEPTDKKEEKKPVPQLLDVTATAESPTH